jgi:hypothetical protein
VGFAGGHRNLFVLERISHYRELIGALNGAE